MNQSDEQSPSEGTVLDMLEKLLIGFPVNQYAVADSRKLEASSKPRIVMQYSELSPDELWGALEAMRARSRKIHWQ